MHLPSLRTDTQVQKGSRSICAAVEPKQKCECTCPVCGHAHKHARKCKRDQDLSSAVVETRKKKGYGAPVQSADRHTRTKLFLHLSETGGVKRASGREHHETELNSKKGGGEGIYVMRRVVCSRKCSLSDLRVVVQLFSKANETGLLCS